MKEMYNGDNGVRVTAQRELQKTLYGKMRDRNNFCKLVLKRARFTGREIAEESIVNCDLSLGRFGDVVYFCFRCFAAATAYEMDFSNGFVLTDFRTFNLHLRT